MPTTDVFDLNVHPAADIFPMLSNEELDDLAADIKANGLLQPLIVGVHGEDCVLIDGRNRREACRRAGVAPRVKELNGIDPVTYILATNVNRRHLTKGQRAMAVAKLYPDPEKGGRGKTVTKNVGVSSQYITEARTVLRWLPEIADGVMAGTKPLNDAYAEAKRLKEQEDAEPRRLERLRERAPDLASRVDDGMALVEAESAFLTRQSTERREHQALLSTIEGLETYVDFFAAGPRRANVVALLQESPERVRVKALFEEWIVNLSETKELL
jgi:hypothetical protein